MMISVENGEDAKLYGRMIEKKLDNSNVGEIASLLQSNSRFVVLAIIIVGDSNVTNLADIYESLDRLFDRDDVGLSKELLTLIAGRGVSDPLFFRRFCRFCASRDNGVRRCVVTWLMRLSFEQIDHFRNSCGEIGRQTNDLISLIILYKSGKLPLVQFLRQVHEIDEIAFEVYEDRAKSRSRYGKRLLRPWHGRVH